MLGKPAELGLRKRRRLQVYWQQSDAEDGEFAKQIFHVIGGGRARPHVEGSWRYSSITIKSYYNSIIDFRHFNCFQRKLVCTCLNCKIRNVKCKRWRQCGILLDQLWLMNGPESARTARSDGYGLFIIGWLVWRVRQRPWGSIHLKIGWISTTPALWQILDGKSNSVLYVTLKYNSMERSIYLLSLNKCNCSIVYYAMVL